MNELVCTKGHPAGPDQLVCEVPGCHRPLVAAGSAPKTKPSGAEPSGAENPDSDRPEATPPPGHRAEERRRPARALELAFADGGARVRVEPGAQELLGRHPELSKHAGRLRDDTVSRRHATIGVGPDGEPWIRDEFSANGTYVNNVKLAPGGGQTLRHGDRIRLGEVLQLKVQLVAARRPIDDFGGG